MASRTPQIDAVLDEGLVCHVGYDDDGPVVFPTIHARVGDVLYLRLDGDSRLAELARAAPRICATVTLNDGIVLGRSHFNHTFNYRSAIVRGPGALVVDRSEKGDALAALVEHLLAGRSTPTIRAPPGRRAIADRRHRAPRETTPRCEPVSRRVGSRRRG